MESAWADGWWGRGRPGLGWHSGFASERHGGWGHRSVNEECWSKSATKLLRFAIHLDHWRYCRVNMAKLQLLISNPHPQPYLLTIFLLKSLASIIHSVTQKKNLREIFVFFFDITPTVNLLPKCIPKAFLSLYYLTTQHRRLTPWVSEWHNHNYFLLLKWKWKLTCGITRPWGSQSIMMFGTLFFSNSTPLFSH